MRKIVTVTPFDSWETANRTIRDVVRQLQFQEQIAQTTATRTVTVVKPSSGGGGIGLIPQVAPMILIGSNADRLAYAPTGTNNLLWQESDRGTVAYLYNVTTGTWVYFEGMYNRTSAQLAALAATLGANDTGYLVNVTDLGEIQRWNGTAFVHFDWVLGRSALVTANGVPYVTGSGTLGEIANNTSSTQKYLAQTSNGTPSWQTIPTSGDLTFYLTTSTSDVATYEKATTLPQATKGTNTSLAMTSGGTFGNWITEPNFPNLTFIPAGVFEFHVHALQVATAGHQSTQLYAEIWEANSSGVDVAKIGTTELTPILTTAELDTSVFFVTSNVYTLAAATSRIVCRVKASVTGAGIAPDIHIFKGGTADSHMSLPSSTVDASNFVPYTGATADVALGTHKITGAGFTGDSGAGGTSGLVPAPAAGDSAAGKFLAAGGGWSVPAGTGGGGGIVVGARASLGTASTSGMAYMCSDSPYQYVSNGSAWIPFIGSWEVAEPSGLTKVNATPTVTLSTAYGGVVFYGTGTGDQCVGYVQSVTPSATLKVALGFTSIGAQAGAGGGLMVYNSNTGNLILFRLINDSTSNPAKLYVSRYTASGGTFSTNSANKIWDYPQWPDVTFILRFSATAWFLDASLDPNGNTAAFNFATENLATFIGTNFTAVGFGANINNPICWGQHLKVIST